MGSCVSTIKQKKIVQLTHSASGHTLHHNGVFSKDGRWVVYDGRNDDTAIGQTTTIGVVDLQAGAEKIIYRTHNSSEYGPGVGAASFSPTTDKVIFIHGLPDADKEKPYGFMRRTGVAVDLQNPFIPINMDARDVTFPYTPGSLRGGTHSHCWSADGRLISFTYNDELVDSDLRTVGIMFDTGNPVRVDAHSGNNNGTYYAAIVADVVAHPRSGSDEISKAFDECWVGEKGYVDAQGKNIPYAVAFQGNTKNAKEETITEIYIVDIDSAAILHDQTAVGGLGERPHVPNGIRQRRISRTARGLSSIVRHWLRASNDGRYVYALAEDDKKRTQVVQCEINSGKLDYLTRNDFSITSPFNLSPDGCKLAFVGNNKVYFFDLKTHQTEQLTYHKPSDGKIVGAPCFSPDGRTLLFNQYVTDADGTFLQIMEIDVHS
ncbi:MAG: DUF3748 domain-containing protein [Chitinophagaceae bacterium]